MKTVLAESGRMINLRMMRSTTLTFVGRHRLHLLALTYELRPQAGMASLKKETDSNKEDAVSFYKGKKPIKMYPNRGKPG
jgi:hypothetical protein